jgi:hypothetical protein
MATSSDHGHGQAGEATTMATTTTPSRGCIQIWRDPLAGHGHRQALTVHIASAASAAVAAVGLCCP